MATQWIRFCTLERNCNGNASRHLPHRIALVRALRSPFRAAKHRSAQIDGLKYSLAEQKDIVKQPDSIKLDETISLSLRPLATGAGCSPSNVDNYRVVLDAPAITGLIGLWKGLGRQARQGAAPV
jgi:hypothetical protein